MASYVDMSLEEIIKKRKFEGKRAKPKPNIIQNNIKKNNNSKGSPTNKMGNKFIQKPIMDARNKIISKKRTQIVDAREKLAEIAMKKDARLKLEQLRINRGMIQGPPAFRRNNAQYNGKFSQQHIMREPVFNDISRHVVSQPLSHVRKTARTQINTKRFLINRSIGTRHQADNRPMKPIVRTVENDIEIIDDPMEGDFIPPNLLNCKPNLQLKIVAHNNDVSGRGRISSLHRLERDSSPPRPPSILKKRPMAALRLENKTDKPDKSLEFRIIVSNLRNSVTGGDIEELFGDVGGMVESRLVRPGTAEVIYKSLEDAQRSVELYHNRQLDGQPMNCLLVTPRANVGTAVKSTSKTGLVSTNSNVEPDLSTFHKVLFSSH